MPHLTIQFLICTIGNRIQQIAAHLPEPEEDVTYLVSWQFQNDCQESLNGDGENVTIPSALKARSDVRVITSTSTGISANRNTALRAASGDILVIADDDCVYTHQSVENIHRAYHEHPEADIILFQLTDYGNKLLRDYPSEPYTYPNVPRGTYFCSCEISFRRASNLPAFNELFGIGAPYLKSAEEQEWVHRFYKEHYGHIIYLPVILGATDSNTTGLRQLTDAGVQRAIGALHRYINGLPKALLRFVKYSVTAPIPFCKKMQYFVHLIQGAVYIGKHSEA